MDWYHLTHNELSSQRKTNAYLKTPAEIQGIAFFILGNLSSNSVYSAIILQDITKYYSQTGYNVEFANLVCGSEIICSWIHHPHVTIRRKVLHIFTLLCQSNRATPFQVMKHLKIFGETQLPISLQKQETEFLGVSERDLGSFRLYLLLIIQLQLWPQIINIQLFKGGQLDQLIIDLFASHDSQLIQSLVVLKDNYESCPYIRLKTLLHPTRLFYRFLSCVEFSAMIIVDMCIAERSCLFYLIGIIEKSLHIDLKLDLEDGIDWYASVWGTLEEVRDILNKMVSGNGIDATLSEDIKRLLFFLRPILKRDLADD